MEIKLQCYCGTKFAFDVEPVNGQMPWQVRCPHCRADGAPALESGSTLFFFDRGMLTAFDLKNGQVRWRLPSAWIWSVILDPQGKLIVTSTTADPDSVKYTQQVKLGKRVDPLLLRVDPAAGKVLWQAPGLGERCYVSGKYFYTTRAQIWSAELIGAMGDESAMKIHHRVRRLDLKTGKEIWEHYRTRGPRKEDFQQNYFLMKYKDELQVLKFL
jgi:outer membrane protein assembly factor BamB